MDSDRNLLFGVLALQVDLIDRNQLVEACTAWAARKDISLAELLRERGWITTADQADVERLLARKLQKHGADVRASLAAVLSEDVRCSLAAVHDPAIATITKCEAFAAPESVHIPPIPLSRERYALTRLHATGGIGRVWVARDEYLGRDVALKELRPERAEEPEHWARFLCEARVTGQLEHPSIVPVYELGKRPENQQPFYTMRLVEGRTLSAAAHAFHQQRTAGKVDSLELRALLTAYVNVCQALAYAHARGVVHRDLKGDNLLLGEFGEVLVLDWGLAKMLGQAEDRALSTIVHVPEDPALRQTLEGQVMGTPAYMAPEQAAGRIDLIDARTDVYGLGAILYELLTGRPPFTGVDTIEVLRKVQTEEPVRPRQMWAGVPLPLEAICLRALAKKPEARYASARELAHEVQRWLADEPVSAYPEPWTLQMRRWLRRHRPVVAAAAALLVTAVVALAVSTVLIQQREQAAQAARQQAEQQRDRADRNLRLARDAVDQTVTKIAGNKLLKQGNFHQLRHDLLQAMVPFYEKFVQQRHNDPALEAERGRAWGSLASLRREMGEKERARSDYEHMRAIFAELATVFPAVSDYRQQLANSQNNLGIVLEDLGRWAEAESVYREALKLRVQLAKDFPAVRQYRDDLAAIHNNLAILLDTLGRQAEAETSHREALKLRAQLAKDFPAVPEYRHNLAASHNNLGSLCYALGKWPDAEIAYREALKIRAQLAKEYPGIREYRDYLAASHNDLGAVMRALKRQTDAEVAFREALKIRTQLVQDFPAVPQYRHNLAASHNNLGAILSDLGKQAEAEAAYRQALKIQAQLVHDFPGEPHYRWHLARSHNNLGNRLRSRRKPAEAEAAYREALKIGTQLTQEFPTAPEYRNDLATSHFSIGCLLADLGRRAEAEAAYREALKIQTQLAQQFPTAPQHRKELAMSHHNLGDLLRELGKSAEAQAAYREALKLQTQLVQEFPAAPAYHHELARTMRNQAMLLRQSNQLDQARRMLEDALPHHQAALQAEPSNPVYRNIFRDNRGDLAEILVDQGEHAAAAETADELIQAAIDPAIDLYNAACIFARCVPLAERDSHLSESEHKERAQDYTERALAALRQAVQNGYKDAAHMKKDSDLDPLRPHQEFQKLLQELEAKPRAERK